MSTFKQHTESNLLLSHFFPAYPELQLHKKSPVLSMQVPWTQTSAGRAHSFTSVENKANKKKTENEIFVLVEYNWVIMMMVVVIDDNNGGDDR